MSALPAFPLEDDEEISSDHLEDDPDDHTSAHPVRSGPDQAPTTMRPPARSGVALGANLDAMMGERAELEWRLYHRGRFAAEHHKLSVLTLRRLDAMYERLEGVRSLEEAIRVVRSAFLDDDERRCVLVPLFAILYPLGFFDDRMPVEDVVRLVAHAERRTPAKRLA